MTCWGTPYPWDVPATPGRWLGAACGELGLCANVVMHFRVWPLCQGTVTLAEIREPRGHSHALCPSQEQFLTLRDVSPEARAR